jgi:hypothetical protein
MFSKVIGIADKTEIISKWGDIQNKALCVFGPV